MSESHHLPPTLRTRFAALLPAWCVLAIALYCTLFAWQLSNERAERTAKQRFDLRTEQLQSAIHSRMRSYEGILNGGVGLFDAVGNVDRRQWREYVDALSLETHFPGILGIGFTERLEAADLEAHQRRVRAEGFSEYVVTPVKPRDEYHAIVMLEPFSGRNLRAFGYDMYTEPARRAAMERARDTGMPALTGKVTLVQETAYDRQAGMLLYVPVYRADMPKATVAQRREALKGFVYAPFRMNDLMRGIMGNQFPDVRLEIFDGETLDPEARLYASDMSAAAAVSEPPRFSRKAPFTFNNKTWLLRVESRPGFEAPEESRLQAGILIGGGIISVLLFAITWSVVSTQVHAKALALRMTQALRGSERRFRAIHDHAAFGIVQTTPDGMIVHTNPAFQRMIGYSEEELQGSHWSMFSAADDQAENQRLRRELLRGERDAYHMEKRYISKDGRLVWGNLAVTGVRAEDGTLQFLVALIEEITARKQQEETITHQAFHDALTGLPNRMRFAERLDQALVKARREKTPMALMFLDLDHFKDVNDALGHGAGDAVLQEVARRLRSCVRATDTVARIGGDEFTVLLPVIDGPNGAVQVAKKILQVLPVTTMIDGQPLTVTPSIGISLFPEHGQNAESLIAQADQAMYASKQSGRNRFTLVSPNAAEPAVTC